jgi:hypothetical protein
MSWSKLILFLAAVTVSIFARAQDIQVTSDKEVGPVHLCRSSAHDYLGWRMLPPAFAVQGDQFSFRSEVWFLYCSKQKNGTWNDHLGGAPENAKLDVQSERVFSLSESQLDFKNPNRIDAEGTWNLKQLLGSQDEKNYNEGKVINKVIYFTVTHPSRGGWTSGGGYEVKVRLQQNQPPTILSMLKH